MIEHPIKLIISAFRDEKDGIYTMLSYTLLASLLSLVIPIGAQVLINSLAAGVMVSPLLVISFLVLLGLSLYGALQVAQLIIVEKIQQKIFANISIKLALHIPKIKLQELKKKYAPDMANRFFEIMTLQKSFAKMLIRWPSAVLQILIGLTLIWIYNIYLLAFSMIIILFMLSIYKLGNGGIKTSIQESTEKYSVADWLEDLARCHFTFKLNSSRDYVHNKTDRLILNYLYARKKHFKIILRQYITYYIFYIVASVGILAIGGWLVIEHRISIGQLVASELIIINILRSTEEIMNFIDNYYDLIAGLDKINSVLDLKTEKNIGENLTKNYFDIQCKNVSFCYDKTNVVENINLNIKPGQRIALIGKSGAGKTSLAYILAGALEPTHGNIYINNIDIRDYNLSNLRSKISIIGNVSEIFKGTVRENIIISNPNCSSEELFEVISLIGLDSDIQKFSNGLDTELVNEGLNISLGQRLRILIARAIIKKPNLLILDEAFLSVDEETKNKIITTIYDKDYAWSVIDISYEYASVIKSDYIYALENGHIIEHGAPQDLLSKQSSFVNAFFKSKGHNNE